MLEINLSGLILKSPVMVGAGPIKTVEQVLTTAKSDSAAIVVGSITVEPREGNPGNTYFAGPHYSLSINSKGLPNPGFEYYKKNLAEMVKIAHEYGKPLIVNIVGFTPQEYIRLSEMVIKSGADGQEINLGCPNIWKGKVQKHIACFDENLTHKILIRIEKSVGNEFWTTVKLSPYSDPYQLQIMSSVISGSKLVNAITTTNSFPNAFYFNNKNKPAITSVEGFGGMGGKSLRPIGLGQVKQFRRFLPSTISIIGVGGIASKQHVEDYLRAGATATQITTAFINYGPGIFKKIKTGD